MHRLMDGGSIPPSSTNSAAYPVEMQGLDGRMMPPSNAAIDQGKLARIGALTRDPTLQVLLVIGRRRRRGTEFGRMK